MQFDYSVLWQAPWSLLAYALLWCAILSLWIKRHYAVWGSLLLLAIIVAMINARLAVPALAYMAIFAGLCYVFFHIRYKILKFLLAPVICVMSLLLGLHKVPGFYNWNIANDLILSENAMPFSLWLNFDKPLVGLFIVGLGTLPLLKTKREVAEALGRTLPIALIGIACIAGLAYLLGYIAFEPKWSNFIIIFFLNNLIVAVFSEEVLFRGFIQHYLAIVFKKISLGKAGNILAILIASILFAWVHTGGLTYIVLAFFAGLLYGAVYAKTKSIEASMFTHVLLNMTHILLFTYPGLA